MKLSELIEALSRPSAYPHPVPEVEVRHTHISVVFLAGDRAYKVKKPVDFGFLDFTSLERRRHFCAEEVRLNRRLAPRVYLGVVPITLGPDGARLDGPGEAIEWAVAMTRLDGSRTLLAALGRGELGRPLVERVARRIAAFHAGAATGDEVSACGRFDVVAHNCRENFEQTEAYVGRTVTRAVWERARERTEAWLERLEPVMEERVLAGRIRDTHGDLHLDHVYHFPAETPPDDLVIVDCIEFNTRFRFADPMADLAFLAMDLGYRGRRDLALALGEAYLAAAGDDAGRELLPFYTAYRAVVRAKVDGFQLDAGEVPPAAREEAAERARGYWLYALGELEEAVRRPALILVGGLPGSGKSTLARRLGELAALSVLAADQVRKELAGTGDGESAAAPFGQGIYSDDWNRRTYAELERRADERLLDGERVVLDATWRDDSSRARLLDLARRRGVPALFLECRAHPEEVERRLGRRQGDVSDADVAVYRKMREDWVEPGPGTRSAWRPVPSDDADRAVDAGLAALRDAGLAERS